MPWIEGAILALLLVCCTPLPLPPGEEAFWRHEREGRESWEPCAKRFGVSWEESTEFIKQAEIRCDSGQGKACEQMAFVEVQACQIFADYTESNKFAAKACALREVSGCRLQLRLCDAGKVSCSADLRRKLQKKILDAEADASSQRGSSLKKEE